MSTIEYPYTQATPAHTLAYLLPAVLEALGGSPGRILDLGCGNGAMARELMARGLDVYGVDASVSGISFANKIAPGRFHLLDISTRQLPDPLAGMTFNTVLSTEVIEHLYDPRSLIELARQALGDGAGGRLIVSTPYHGYLKNLALALTGKLDQHFTVGWDGGHIKFFSRRSLQQMLLEQGFKPLSFRGAGRLPFLWRSMVITASV
jgi:2-polyprenyl-3-methyl-5-hydroxy-6-metoxy-1,4-benzoquinol methylase